MHSGFMDTSSDVQWLKDTALKGVPLPVHYAQFQSFVLQGNGDAPYAVNLYVSDTPGFEDSYYRIRFENDSGAYAECCEYNGKTDTPYNGLIPIS